MTLLWRSNILQNKRKIIINVVFICHIHVALITQAWGPNTLQNKRKIMFPIIKI